MSGGELLRRFLELSAKRIDESVADLQPSDWVARPQGLAPIIWQLGHLALSDLLLLKRAGEEVEVPAGYEQLFGRGTGGGGPFPPSDEVQQAFRRARDGLMRLAEGDLARPARSPTGLYETVGGGLAMSLYHHGYHHGKIMTLRALLGKPRLLG